MEHFTTQLIEHFFLSIDYLFIKFHWIFQDIFDPFHPCICDITKFLCGNLRIFIWHRMTIPLSEENVTLVHIIWENNIDKKEQI